MSTRRKFFSRLGAAIATIALAPELAFRAKLALPEVEERTLTYACNQNGFYERLVESADLFLDAKQSGSPTLDLEELFLTAYDLKQKRQRAGISEHYLLVKVES